MKKRIFTFLTLLVAFFGLIGLTTNNYKVINAAGNQSTVDSDLAAINIPETALISFPVTYKSVYGNDIDWSVEEDQNIITYDEEAHWMVVNRPTEGVDQEIDITVTVTGADNATATKTVTVTVPVGVTATRSFSITYVYGYENPVTVNNPEQYKLGQATIELLEPAREGYMFDGWYAGEQKVEKILVGSMQDYTLTAHWTQVAIDSIYVKTNPTKTTYNALETFDGAGIEVYAQYNNGEEEAIPFENLTFNKTTLHGNDNEVEVSYSGKTTTVSITVNKLDYAINKENFKDTSKEYNGQAQQIEYTGVLPEGLTATYTGSAKNVADGTVTITLSFTNANEIDYNTPEDLTANLTILPKTVTLTTTSKSIDLGEEIEWEFTGGEFIEPDTISVVDLTKVTPTYKLNGQSVNPENFVTGQTYDVEFIGATADNYTVEIEPATLTINAVEVNLSAEALTYTGQEQTFVAIAKDALGQEITGGTFTYDGKATATGTNADTYSIEVVFTHPSHPTVTKTIDFIINPKKVTITASDVTSVYGTLPELENKWSQEGILDADLDDFVVEVTTNATETSIPDTYETTANCTSTNSNYVVEYVSGTHTVTKKQVTVTVDETTITSVYGDTLATLKYKLAEGSSLVAGDEAEFSQLISLSTTATSNSNAGEYDITITAGESNKYDIEVAEQLPKYVITPKDLTDLVEVTVNGSDWNIQDSTSLTPGVTVKYGELTITTYELTYEYANETIKVGQATITVEFNGNYTGEAEAQFLITENGLAVEDGKLLAQKYASVLTGTLTTIEQLDVEGTNGSTITWITDSTALSINSEGNVTITRPTGKDEEVILYAHINYGKSSEDVISFEFTVEGIYSLESTNVKIENIGSGYTLNAETIAEANLEQANFQISENEQYVTAYDISFTQGEDINAQPGKVTVKLAVPEEYKDNEGLVIYHVKDDETSETISNYTFDGNYVVFEADSFSPYVVTIKTYKVTFLDKDGEVIETQTVKHGSSATAPDAPEVEGYTFNGWKGTYTNVKDNVTIEAEYKGHTGSGEGTETVTVSIQEYATANDWVNSTKYTTINMDDNITLTANGGGNTGKYYTNGYDWRMYQSENATVTVEAKEGLIIVSVKITYNVSNSGVLTYGVENITSETIVTVNENTVTFGVSNTGSATNGQVRITAIEVVYSGGSSSEESTHVHTPCVECGGCTAEDCDGTAEDKCPGHEAGKIYFEKVTSAPTDWSGTYLIVYEDGKVAFDGSLETLDAVSNTKAVTISDGKIEATAEMKAIAFTITQSGSEYTIKSASGYYIGQTSNNNGLSSHTSTVYNNQITLDGDVNIVSGGAYLRYNDASNQNRFRYYKSSSYSGQKAITLYKLSE